MNTAKEEHKILRTQQEFLKLYLFIYSLTLPALAYAMPGWPPHIFHCHWLHQVLATTVMVLFIL